MHLSAASFVDQVEGHYKQGPIVLVIGTPKTGVVLQLVAYLELGRNTCKKESVTTSSMQKVCHTSHKRDK